MELMHLIKYNSKILKSRTYVLFFLVALIIPAALQLCTAMYFEMIIPLCGIFIFSNMMFYEESYKVYKNFYMTKIAKRDIFLLRLLINIIFYLLMSGVFYIYIVYIVKNTFEDTSIVIGPMSNIVMMGVGLVNYLLFGFIAMTIAHISKRPILGMSVSILYGVFWMVNYYNFSESFLNPFTYSSNNENYVVYKLIEIIIIIILVIFNCRLIDSKFYNE